MKMWKIKRMRVGDGPDGNGKGLWYRLQTAPGTQEKLHYCVNYWVLNVSFSTDCSILGGQLILKGGLNPVLKLEPQ